MKENFTIFNRFGLSSFEIPEHFGIFFSERQDSCNIIGQRSTILPMSEDYKLLNIQQQVIC